MKEKINEAFNSYQRIKDEVEEQPENAREALLEVLENPMMDEFFDTSKYAKEVEELDLPEEAERFKEIVDEFQSKVSI